MRAWLPVIVTIILAVLTVAANAIVNTTIKFAPDAETARKDLKQLGSTALRRLSVVAMVAFLAYNVVSPAPMTGIRVFGIALAVGALVYALVATSLMKVYGHLERAGAREATMIENQIVALTNQTEVLKSQTEVMKAQKIGWEGMTTVVEQVRKLTEHARMSGLAQPEARSLGTLSQVRSDSFAGLPSRSSRGLQEPAFAALRLRRGSLRVHS